MYHCVKNFQSDRLLPSCRVPKVFLYSHRGICPLAASSFKCDPCSKQGIFRNPIKLSEINQDVLSGAVFSLGKDGRTAYPTNKNVEQKLKKREERYLPGGILLTYQLVWPLTLCYTSGVSDSELKVKDGYSCRSISGGDLHPHPIP